MLRIFLPTDFSDNAQNAIRFALKFFEQQKCLFYILHTYTPAFYRMDYLIGGPTFSAIPDVGVDISMAGLERTKDQILKEHPNTRHEIELISAFNLLTDQINQTAREKSIDLVVMGTQGASGTREIFLGSNTVYVIRKAEIPVLAVPAGYIYKKVRNILLPSGLWSKYRKEEVNILRTIATKFNAEITVLHVLEEYELTEKQKENQSHLEELLAGIPHRFMEIRDQLMPQAVMGYIDEHKTDLLVMMNKKHGFLERLMWRQNVDQIGFHVKIPFLVIRDSSPINK